MEMKDLGRMDDAGGSLAGIEPASLAKSGAKSSSPVLKSSVRPSLPGSSQTGAAQASLLRRRGIASTMEGNELAGAE